MIMNQLRLDPLTGRWVVMAVQRGERPNAFLERTVAAAPSGERCPFCPGNESDTPPAIATEPPEDSGSPWMIRVVPNLYPAFTGNDALAVTNLGPVYMQAPANGSHEVAIFSPDHQRSWADLDSTNVSMLMHTLQARVRAHGDNPHLRYSQVIVNYGREAGASVEHPHAQLLGIPFVPRELADEQGGFARFRGNCLMCATVESEEWTGVRMVHTDNDAVVFCPFWSGMPYELLVVPRTHERQFTGASSSQIEAVGNAVQIGLRALRNAAGDVAYNLVFHSSPFRGTTDFHWHVHILPKITTPAGFELGTGVPLNVVAPETAAVDLRREH